MNLDSADDPGRSVIALQASGLTGDERSLLVFVGVSLAIEHGGGHMDQGRLARLAAMHLPPGFDLLALIERIAGVPGTMAGDMLPVG